MGILTDVNKETCFCDIKTGPLPWGLLINTNKYIDIGFRCGFATLVSIHDIQLMLADVRYPLVYYTMFQIQVSAVAALSKSILLIVVNIFPWQFLLCFNH
jgi:hypothetical protein